ncbi:YrbL family protein [Pseudoxanthomonas sp. z9]|uniref:YrbL family protein n=1 Tax=Pseudoxanthomonas sp. z9 TaxID=2584942 RepID=UPI0015E8B0DB|nr:YrbL family protein [Pseudoxanthomonas sp. z9]
MSAKPHAPYPPLGAHWDGLTVLARGANRLCALAPDDAGHCLKFELHPDERPAVGLRARLRRSLAAGENATEWRAWQRLRARIGPALDGWLAPCTGIVATRWGPALRCVLVRDADGAIARSLYAHLFEGTRSSPESLCAAVDAMERELLAHDVPLFDLNAGNFVVAGSAAQPRLVCVDAKSTLSGKEILPFSRWSRRLMHRKIRRRAGRLRQRIRAALADAPPPH